MFDIYDDCDWDVRSAATPVCIYIRASFTRQRLNLNWGSLNLDQAVYTKNFLIQSSEQARWWVNYIFFSKAACEISHYIKYILSSTFCSQPNMEYGICFKSFPFNEQNVFSIIFHPSRINSVTCKELNYFHFVLMSGIQVIHRFLLGDQRNCDFREIFTFVQMWFWRGNWGIACTDAFIPHSCTANFDPKVVLLFVNLKALSYEFPSTIHISTLG